MSDFVKKKLYMMKLAEELRELENQEQYKKQNAFIEGLYGLLDKHAYTMDDLKNMLGSVYSSTPESIGTVRSDGRGRPKGERIPSHEIEYEGVTYKVNEKGKQPTDTKQLLDKLGMTPADFIEEFGPHPHEKMVQEA